MKAKIKNNFEKPKRGTKTRQTFRETKTKKT